MQERWLPMSDGVTLRASVEGEGPPVVMCHGGPGLWDYFDDLAAKLADHFTVYRWDQRGCGRSDPSPTYGLDVAVRDVQDVKAAFGVDVSWSVIGHSWGAYLGLLTALQHPESTSALVAIAGTGTPGWWREVGKPLYQAERVRRMTPTDRDRLRILSTRERSQVDEVEFRRLSWITDFANPDDPPAALEKMASSPLAINFDLNRVLNNDRQTAEDELSMLLDRCAVPSLFVHGTQDPRPGDGAQLLAERLQAGQYVEIPDAGHMPWVEQPVETIRIISQFLHGLEMPEAS